MILREATIKYSGRDPDKLAKGSHIRICVSCNNCGRVRWLPKQAYRDLCKSCSRSGENSSCWKEKITKICEICGNEFEVFPSEQNRKCCSNECKGKRQSLNQIGENNPMYGVHRTGKDSPFFGKFGKDANGWKGGIANIRDHVLPTNKCLHINEKFIGSHAHHISSDVVIFIPKELHEHISHNMKNGNGIYEMNMLSLQYIKGEL